MMVAIGGWWLVVIAHLVPVLGIFFEDKEGFIKCIKGIRFRKRTKRTKVQKASEDAIKTTTKKSRKKATKRRETRHKNTDIYDASISDGIGSSYYYDSDYASYRAAREERAAYDDYIASIDMDDN